MYHRITVLLGSVVLRKAFIITTITKKLQKDVYAKWKCCHHHQLKMVFWAGSWLFKKIPNSRCNQSNCEEWNNHRRQFILDRKRLIGYTSRCLNKLLSETIPMHCQHFVDKIERTYHNKNWAQLLKTDLVQHNIAEYSMSLLLFYKQLLFKSWHFDKPVLRSCKLMIANLNIMLPTTKMT